MSKSQNFHNNKQSLQNKDTSQFHQKTNSTNLTNQSILSMLTNISRDDYLNMIETSGTKPTKRFGHSIILLNKVKTCLFGGAVGDIKNFKYVNETYIFNLMTKMWHKINFPTNMPLPKERAAHAAASNDNNQMVIHGGSIGNSMMASDELWMFDMKSNKEEEGKWVLIKTVGVGPGKIYGHTLSYMKPYFVLFGGSLSPVLSNAVWIIDINAIQIAWTKLDFDVGPSPRLYHTCGFCNKGDAQGLMIMFGGRDSKENPLNDIWGLRRHRDGKWDWVLAPISKGRKIKPRYNHSVVFFGSLMIIIGGRARGSSRSVLPIEVYDTERSETYEFPGIGLFRQSSFVLDSDIFLYGGFSDKDQMNPIENISKFSLETLFENSPLLSKLLESKNKNSMSFSNKISRESSQNQKSKFRLSQLVVVGSGTENENGELEEASLQFRKISINKLTEENKRIGENMNVNSINSLLQTKHVFNVELINNFIDTLHRPFDWFEPKMEEFHKELRFTDDSIISLIKEVKPLIERDQTLIKIRSPCKIFGNLYGEYNDLMRYFESFGNPSDDNQMGDISVMQYVFLGDFCDRGYYSLEVIFLLFSLKVKYPDSIYLIRGHHEDINMNKIYGLGQECKERLSDSIENQNSIFKAINEVFDYLPLGILIDNSILCIHGGIGSSLNSLKDIEQIKRPVSVQQEITNSQQQIVLDILWSEYSDDVSYVDINTERDKNKYGFIVKFGKERLNKFLRDNQLTLLINSHQYIQEGFMTFNDDKLLTIFSATNYMDKYKNLGGMITIGKKTPNRPMNIMPKMINVYAGQKESYRKNRSPSPIRTTKI